MTVAQETGELRNPGHPGNEEFDTLIYGSPPLVYPAVLSQYVIYNTPDPAYVTGRINVSAFANLGAATPWPFTNTNVPLNGHICIPRGRGPFPLAVFAHGNHSPFENSTPGYLYLCQLLASHGIIAATIDVNFLNGSNFGENDARAIVHLEHLKQFRSWNNTAGHPLHGKVELNRISDRRPFSWRRGRRPRFLLQPAGRNWPRCPRWLRGAWPVPLRTERSSGHRPYGSAIRPRHGTHRRPGFLLHHSR